MADDRLDDEERDVLGAQRGLERVEVVERDAREARAASGSKRSEKAGSPVAESAPSVSPWKPRSTETHARAPGRRAADLDRGLDRLGARAREQDAPEARGRAPQQLLGEDRAQRVDAERELPRRVELERL